MVIGSSPLLQATSTPNLLYASPGHTGTLPLRSTFNIAIKVANFEPFDGWNIYVRTNASVINPVALSITGNIFEANGTGASQFELANCINRSGTSGCTTDPLGGIGVVQSAVSYLGGTLSGSGLLFTITYNVTGVGFSDISIFNDFISNGSKSTVAHTTISGTYGVRPPKPDFSIEPLPDLGITLTRTHNVSQSATIVIDSVDNLSGLVSISVSTMLTASVKPSSIFLPTGGTNSSTVTITATNTTTSTQYLVNVTAVISSIHHSEIFSVQVNPIPDFIISVSPSLLNIPATGYGLSVVTIDTETGFTGQIHLKLDVPSGPVAWLDATEFTISPGQPSSTLLEVRTPSSDFPFKYLINITASSPSSATHMPFTVTVKPPKPDFSFQIASPDFIIQAGQSRSFTISTASVNYFKGQIFLLASTLSGINEKFSRPSLALEYGNSSTSLMMVSTDAFLALGFHSINVTALGTTFLGDPVNHSVIISVKIIPSTGVLAILGLHPLVYFGIVGTLWAGLIGVAVKEIRKPKPQRFLH
jgi:hypothetical protein